MKKAVEITNPFSEEFLIHWETWKSYKKEQFSFRYKGVHSEQAALIELCNLSGGDEDVAVKILLQSMAAGWRGIWPLKKPTSLNGKSKKSADEAEQPSSLREEAAKVFNTRNAGGGSKGSSDHLKAV